MSRSLQCLTAMFAGLMLTLSWGPGATAQPSVRAASSTVPAGSPVYPTRQSPAPIRIDQISPGGTTASRPLRLQALAAGSPCTIYTPGTTVNPAEIVELARALKYDPVLIFQYVHDNIEFDPIWGSMKGALGTLLDGRGGAFDQAALTVALLNESANYNTAISNVQFVQGKVTLSAAQISGWLRTDSDVNSIGNVLSSGGYPSETYYGSGGTTVTQALIDHVWVQLSLSGTTVSLDPAFKFYTSVAGINLASAMGYTQGNLLTGATAGATSSASSLQLSSAGYSSIGSNLSNYATSLANTIAQSYPTASLAQIIGGATIAPFSFTYTQSDGVSAALYLQQFGPASPSNPSPYNQSPVAPSSVTTYGAIPNTLRANLQVTLQNAACEQFYSSDIYGHRLSIVSGGGTNAPVLNLDGQQIVASPTGFAAGTPISVQEAVSLPWQPQFGQNRTQQIAAGSTYVVMNGWDQVGRGMIEKHQRILAQNRAAGGADGSEAVLGESLNIIGYNWLSQIAQRQRIADEVLTLRTEYLYGVGIVGQAVGPTTQGPYVDLPLNQIGTPVRANGSAANAASLGLSAFFDDSGISSGFEAGVLRQAGGVASNGLVASTTAILNLAAQTGATFYDLKSPSDYTAYSGQLNWSSGNLTALQTSVGQGFRVIAPAAPAASQSFAFGSWKGVGYKGILINQYGTGILEAISGGLSGGFAGVPLPAGTLNLNLTAGTQAANPPPADVSANPVAKTGGFSGILTTVGDPLDRVSGAYIYAHDDLTFGSRAFPYGLGFQRSYASSAAQFSGSLGNGWTHNYAFSTTTTSDGFAGLGGSTALAAAPVIAAAVISADLIALTPSSQPTLTQLVVGAVVDQWLIDRLVQNVVAVSKPDGAEEFVRLPAALADGRTFAAPAGSATRLSQASGTTYQTKDGVTLTFDGNGRLTTWANAAGVTVTLTYNGAGQLSGVANNLGRHLTLAYSGTTLSSVSDVPASGTARTVSYGYDGNGNLTSVTDPLGQKTMFAYDTAGTYYAARGHLTGVFYPSGQGQPFVTNLYDSLGRVRQQTDASGNVTQAYFAGYRSELVNGVGARHVWTLDPAGRVLSDIQAYYTPGVPVLRPCLVGFGFPPGALCRADGDYQLATSYAYDGQGNVTQATRPNGDIIATTYDALFNPLTINRSGSVNTLSYTQPLAGLVNFERITTARDPNGNLTSYQYDTAGNLAEIDQPAVAKPGVTGSVVPRQTFSYVNFGLLQTATDAEGRVTRTDYDPTALENAVRTTIDYGAGRGNLATQYGYDAYGNVTSVTDANSHTTIRKYDALRRLTEIDGAVAGVVTQLGYDSEGRLTSLAKATGVAASPWQTSTTLYTPTGKTQTTTDPAGYVTTYAYDAADRLASLTDEQNRIRLYAYDHADRLGTVTDGTAGSGNPILERYLYTKNGLVSSFTDARNQTTSYSYGPLDTLIEKKYSDVRDFETYTYDANGNLLTRTTPSKGTITYTYDALNRVTSKTPSGEAAGTVTYGYDLSGLLLQASDASSTNAYTIGYDNAGRPVTRTDQGGSVWGRFTWARVYDNAGNLLVQGYPNGYWVSYQRDAMNRVTEIDFQWDTTRPVAKYQWDALSRRTLLTYGDGSTAAYGYAANDDLTSLAHTLPGGASVTLGYGYDHTHRRISETSSNPAYAFAPAPGSVTYGAASVLNAYPTVGAATLTYDNNHNLTFDGANTLGYDVENRLISASNAGGVSSYLYDPLGHRKQSTIAGQNTHFMEDGDREISEFTGDWGNLIEFVRGPGDEVVASLSYQTTAFDPTYYHNDPLGSPLAVTHAGAVTNTLAYGPYGETSSLAGPALRYTGYRLDAETGLYYARARHYSPTLGRFLQFDPIGINGGTNLYAYTANDPLNSTDPTGLLANQVAKGAYGLLQAVNPVSTAQAAEDPELLRMKEQLGGATSLEEMKAGHPIQPFQTSLLFGVPGVGVGPFAPPNGGVALSKPYGPPTSSERAQVNALGAQFGCHTCGTKDFDTATGNPILDHQPPQALNPPPGMPAYGYPQCPGCSSRQGGLVSQILRRFGLQ